MRVTLVGTAVVVLVAGLFLVRPGPVARVDDKICDLLTGFLGPRKPSGRVVIVEIDERSLAEYGRWPWPRDLLGSVVRRILDRGAATVVLDIMLHEEDRGASSALPSKGIGTNDDVLAGVFSGKP